MATVAAPDVQTNSVAPVSFGTNIYRKELDLVPKSLYAPIYKYRRLIQVSGGSGLTLTTGPSNSIFNIPGGGVYNYAKSYLQWDLNLTNGAANYNSVWCDQVPIQDITLQTQTGQIIANLTGVPVYTKTARFLCTNMKDYLARESVGTNTTVAGALGTQNYCCQPAKVSQQAINMPAGYLNWIDAATSSDVKIAFVGSLAGSITKNLTSASLTAKAVTSQYIVQAGTVSVIPAAAASGTIDDFLSPQHLGTGAVGGAVGGDIIMRYKIDLDAFVGTILAANRNLYFGGQNMQLNINFCPLNKWGFNSTLLGGTVVSLAAGTLSNYYLYLAQEMVEENIASAKMAVDGPGGQSIMIPYTICPKLSVGAAGLTTMNTPLVAGFGVLKRVLTTVVHNTDQDNFGANTENVAGVKYTQVQSFLNNSPMQDYQMLVANNEDYNYLQNMLEDTPAGISSRNYRINSFWCDNFSDADKGYMFPENDLMDSGHEIVNSENYSIQFLTVPAAVQIYQFCTFLRRLVISNSVIQWA